MSKTTLPRIDGGAIALPFDRAAKHDELAQLRKQGADIFELRLDLAGNPTQAQAAMLSASFAGHPLIATCRHPDEGGQGDADVARLSRLAACVEHASALDIELAAASILPEAKILATKHGCELIVSFHDLNATPELARLENIMDDAFAAGATVAKIVTTVTTEADLANLQELLALARSTNRPLAIMGMGETDLALRSRLELARAGSLFVFARAGLETTPGQPELAWLASQLRGN